MTAPTKGRSPMAFSRSFEAAGIKSLKKPLFNECLLPDIKKGEVFPAVRENRIDFYYKGGCLFSFKRPTFKTHYKYASVIRNDSGSDYVSEKNLHAIKKFKEGYERIKDNCAHYSGVEAQGVSRLYGNYSCAKRHRASNVVVLDIEVFLRRGREPEEVEPGADSQRESDRIDLLLFDTNRRWLRFFEVKDYSNKDIRISENAQKVAEQMDGYEKRLNTAKAEILAAYKEHVGIINKLFKPAKKLPMPQAIDPTPGLLMFGYDLDQHDGKLRDIVNHLEKRGIFVYTKGDINNLKPSTLFNGGKNRWRVPLKSQS